jgi:hypothetical protein
MQPFFPDQEENWLDAQAATGLCANVHNHAGSITLPFCFGPGDGDLATPGAMWCLPFNDPHRSVSFPFLCLDFENLEKAPYSGLLVTLTNLGVTKGS